MSKEDKITCTDVQVKRGHVIVELEYIGEGRSGDYDPDDPNDEPLMRFRVLQADEDGDISEVDNASYCTLISAALPKEKLKALATLILNKVADPVVRGASIKKLCEELSWIDESWIEKERA